MKGVVCSLAVTMLLFLPNVAHQITENISFRGKIQELHLYGTIGAPPVVLGSGDLGWIGLVVDVAEFLAAHHYYVIGLNSRAYLASFSGRNSSLDPRDVPGDYQMLIQFARRRSSLKPVLAGVSEGAGLSVLAATDPEIQSAVRGVLALGLPDQNELGWKWQDFTVWITRRPPDEPSFMVEDIIRKVSPTPLAEIHSTHDEFLPLEKARVMFSLAGEPKKMWVVDAANHRFSNNRTDLDRKILEAMQWIESIK